MKNIVIKIILTPFIFLYGCLLVTAGLVFPLSFAILTSFIGIIISPFVYLLRSIGNDIDYMEAPEIITGNNFIDLLLMCISPLWIPFYVLYEFYTDKLF